MGKSITEDAVVTASSSYGEMHRIVTLYTRDNGVQSAVIYGGRKGKNASVAPVFSYGHYLLTFSKNNSYPSIKEGQNIFYASEILKDISKTYRASYLCETCMQIKTHENNIMFNLLVSALTELENQYHNDDKVIIDYTWSLIKISGIRPNLINCPQCNKRFTEKEIVHFSDSLCCPVCDDCADCHTLLLPPGARKYLLYTEDKTFEESLDIELYADSMKRIKSYLLSYISKFCQYPLKTIQSGLL